MIVYAFLVWDTSFKYSCKTLPCQTIYITLTIIFAWVGSVAFKLKYNEAFPHLKKCKENNLMNTIEWMCLIIIVHWTLMHF